MDLALYALRHGAEHPYDAPDTWREKDAAEPPPMAVDWAHAAARGILADLNGRRGIKWELAEVEEETRVELTASLAAIIRIAIYNPAVLDTAVPGYLRIYSGAQPPMVDSKPTGVLLYEWPIYSTQDRKRASEMLLVIKPSAD